MSLLVFLIILSVHISMASKESIEHQISNVKDMMKKMKENPNFSLSRASSSTHKIQLTIPPGAQRYYGAQKDLETARKAISMIVQEYLNSLEHVLEGTLKSPVTFELLKQKYDEMFPKPGAPNISKVKYLCEKTPNMCPGTVENLHSDERFWNHLVSKFENTLKKIEQNPNFGLQQINGKRYYIQLSIPCGERHIYGSHQDQTTARKAVLMIAQEYKKSLEAKSPATKEDLQQKYDAMFPEIKQQIMISKFEDALKKIEQNQNFGLQFSGNRIYVNVRIPIGERYLYGSHSDHATARKALLMIADEYMKSLEVETPATFHQLKLKYDAMFGEAQKKVFLPSECNYEENKFDTENGKKNLRMIFQRTSQKPNQANEENGTTRDNSELNEKLSNSHKNHRERFQIAERQPTKVRKQSLRKSTDEQNKASSFETDEKPSNKVYKIRRTWNLSEDKPEHDFILGGFFKVKNPPDVFWVNTIKKVDGRLSGYYKEYGGCRGWVNLEYVESTDFDGPKKMSETLKRKREESESSIGESESEESTRGSSNN